MQTIPYTISSILLYKNVCKILRGNFRLLTFYNCIAKQKAQLLGLKIFVEAMTLPYKHHFILFPTKIYYRSIFLLIVY